MLILKFGGTSVGSAKHIKSLMQLISDISLNSNQVIVVLSAMSGTTNSLVEISENLHSKKIEKAKLLINELEDKYLKEINNLYSTEEYLNKGKELVSIHFNLIESFLSFKSFSEKEEKIILAQGELLSTHMFYYYLCEAKKDSVLIPALEFMKIDERKEPNMIFIKNQVENKLKNITSKIVITQGYICRNFEGDIDNLQRGGSDYTACIIGAVLNAENIQIWTDIDGMHNNDPRFVENTSPIGELSFDEAAELAYFGAKILHPTCILPAQKNNVPVILKNTMEPKAKGTLIGNVNKSEGIRAIAAKDGIYIITIKSTRMLLAHGFLKKVFEIFEKYKTSIDVVTTSEVAISLTIDKGFHLEEIKREIQSFAQVEIFENQTIIAIVGYLPKAEIGIEAKILNSLSSIPLHMISYGGSEHNITIVVDSKYKKKVLQTLHQKIFENKDL